MLTAEQKQKRVGLITSSTAAAVLGVDETESPIDAWLKIRGEGPDNEDMDPTSAKACERGNALEDFVLAWGADRLDLDRCEAPFRIHSEHEFLGDSADALFVSRETGGPVHVGEAKTVSLGGAHHYGIELTDEIPMHALVQSHMHLAHWPDAESCYLPVMIGGYAFEFRMYEVKRNQEFEDIMIKKLGAWHRKYIVGDLTPPATYRDTSYLTSKYSDRRETEPMPPTSEVRHWAEKKAMASRKLKQAEEEEDLAKNRLRDMLGHHEICESSDWGKVTWKYNRDKKSINYEALVDDLLSECPEDEVEKIIKPFSTTKRGARVLRVALSKALKRELGL